MTEGRVTTDTVVREVYTKLGFGILIAGLPGALFMNHYWFIGSFIAIVAIIAVAIRPKGKKGSRFKFVNVAVCAFFFSWLLIGLLGGLLPEYKADFAVLELIIGAIIVLSILICSANIVDRE